MEDWPFGRKLTLLLYFEYALQIVTASGIFRIGFLLYDLQLTQDLTAPPSSSASSNNNILQVPLFSDGSVTPFYVRGSRLALVAEEKIAAGVASPWIRGSTCDGSSFRRPIYRFLLCLDYVDRELASNPCRLGKIETDELPRSPSNGHDLVAFPTTLGMSWDRTIVPNPAVFAFDRWEGPVRLKVHVTCCGVMTETEGQCREVLSTTLSDPPGVATLSHVPPQSIVLTGRSRLVAYLTLTCDPDYYGPMCERRCRVESPLVEHAFCNLTTGLRQCLNGWESADCQRDVDECQLQYCQHGATCSNSPPGSFTCQCALGYTGRVCQKRVPVCASRPCKNGGLCQEQADDFLCTCSAQFAGRLCDQPLATTAAAYTTTTLHSGASLSTFGTSVLSSTFTSAIVTNSVASNGTQNASMVGPGWQSWQTGVVVSAALCIIAVVGICCLIRSRGVPDGPLRSSSAVYRIFITSKSFNNIIFGHRTPRGFDSDHARRQGPTTPASEGDRHPHIVHPHLQHDLVPCKSHLHHIGREGKFADLAAAAIQNVEEEEEDLSFDEDSDWDSDTDRDVDFSDSGQVNAKVHQQCEPAARSGEGRFTIPFMPETSPRMLFSASQVQEIQVYAVNRNMPDSQEQINRDKFPSKKPMNLLSGILLKGKNFGKEDITAPDNISLKWVRRVDSQGYEVPARLFAAVSDSEQGKPDQEKFPSGVGQQTSKSDKLTTSVPSKPTQHRPLEPRYSTLEKLLEQDHLYDVIRESSEQAIGRQPLTDSSGAAALHNLAPSSSDSCYEDVQVSQTDTGERVQFHGTDKPPRRTRQK